MNGLHMKKIKQEGKISAPLLSVITVVYNSVNLLESTIESVTNQEYPNIEYIIIDGGSTDGTVDIIKKFESVIDFWISEPDTGIYDAMNKGIAKASGEWISLMNSGDLYSSSTALNFLNNCRVDVDIYYSDTILLTGKHPTLSIASVENKTFIHQSMVYKKSMHEKHGGYLSSPGITISDYLFFACFWLTENSEKVHEPIAKYRVDGLSSNRSHFYQKLAVDLMRGDRSPFKTALILLAYPYYKALKMAIKSE